MIGTVARVKRPVAVEVGAAPAAVVGRLKIDLEVVEGIGSRADFDVFVDFERIDQNLVAPVIAKPQLVALAALELEQPQRPSARLEAAVREVVDLLERRSGQDRSQEPPLRPPGVLCAGIDLLDPAIVDESKSGIEVLLEPVARHRLGKLSGVVDLQGCA